MDTVTRTPVSPLPARTQPASFWQRLQTNRELLIRLTLGLVAVIAFVAAAVVFVNERESSAESKLADAMRDYDAPIATPEQPLPPSVKSFKSLQDKAQATFPEFKAVADKYGSTDAGRNALYMAGVTAMQSGQNATAEDLLKKAASSWDHDVATLAELTLGELYHSTGRDADAINEYQAIANKPSKVVPASMAQLSLASLYESTGKQEQARKIYAQIKDKDPKSPAAEIATQKLGGPGTAPVTR